MPRPPDKLYLCPGEIYPISRAVHLSRLAAFYPKCRDCPLRTETGQIPTQTVKRLQSTERRVERKSLMTAEGVRAVYLNELTRSRAGQIAAAFAGLLWEQAPMLPAGMPDGLVRRKHRPTVVVGHDERPSSPDIVRGVAGALRQWGCQVIDIGVASTPCFWFAVDHLAASGGILVTGSGCEPSWTGLSFAGPNGAPVSTRAMRNVECGASAAEVEMQPSTVPNPRFEIRNPRSETLHPETEFNQSEGAIIVPHSTLRIPHSTPLDLTQLEVRVNQPLSRPTRQAGPQRTFRATLPYEAGLWKHFHALRPLRICIGVAAPAVARTLERVFAELPCRLMPVPLPTRVRRLSDPLDADVARVSAGVREHSAHLGVVIDDDGQGCAFLEERGGLIPTAAAARLLADVVRAEHPEPPIVAADALVDALRVHLGAASPAIVHGGATLASMSAALQARQAVFGVSPGGRFWFRETIPTCDAVLALARMLQALSRSDTPCSRLLDD